MLRMIVPLDVFWMLKGLADRNNVKNTEWGHEAKVSVIRLSEFARLYRIQTHQEEPPARPIKRAFTLEIAHALYQSLKKIIGADAMKKSIRELLEKETDPYKRLLLMVVVKSGDGDKEFITKAADYVEMLFKANDSK